MKTTDWKEKFLLVMKTQTEFPSLSFCFSFSLKQVSNHRPQYCLVKEFYQNCVQTREWASVQPDERTNPLCISQTIMLNILQDNNTTHNQFRHPSFILGWENIHVHNWRVDQGIFRTRKGTSINDWQNLVLVSQLQS